MEFGKFETKPYIKAMRSKIEIFYPTEITDIIKARRAASRAQLGSSSGPAEQHNITPGSALRPNVTIPSEAALEPDSAQPTKTTPNNMALGN